MTRDVIMNFENTTELTKLYKKLEKSKVELEKFVKDMKMIGFVDILIEYSGSAIEIIQSWKRYNKKQLDIVVDGICNGLYFENEIPNNCIEITLIYWITKKMPRKIHDGYIRGLFDEGYYQLSATLAYESDRGNSQYLLEISLDELLVLMSEEWLI